MLSSLTLYKHQIKTQHKYALDKTKQKMEETLPHHFINSQHATDAQSGQSLKTSHPISLSSQPQFTSAGLHPEIKPERKRSLPGRSAKIEKREKNPY